MMRKRNWKEYNRELVQRGSLTFLIDPKLLNSKPKRYRKNGRPQEFSDQFITLLMMVKIHFRLTYRALEGFMKYLAGVNKWNCPIPSYSLICKRAAYIKEALPSLSRGRPTVVLLDASGMKVLGEGEWKVKVHGRQKRRRWVKIHIALDAKTQEIIAEVTTPSSVKDGKMTNFLLKDMKGSVKKVIADGSYDERESREAIRQKKAKALIPPPRNARLWGTDADRDDAIRIIRGLGGDKEAKSLWGKLTGYSIRALVETSFSRMKRLFGERFFSKILEKQAIESRIRCFLLNKMIRKEYFPPHQHSAKRLG
jgi:hypothetical protein